VIRFCPIERHPVNRVDQVLVTYCEIEILQGLLLVTMPKNHAYYRGMDAAAHRVGLPAVAQIVNGWTLVEVQGFGRCSPRARQGMLTRRTARIVAESSYGQNSSNNGKTFYSWATAERARLTRRVPL